jgi:hypothetical protein
MRLMRGLLAALVLMGAGTGVAEAGYHQDYAFVWRVNVGESKHLWINVYGNFSPLHGCPERWYARSKYDLDDARTQAMRQLAQTSFLAHSQIHVWTNGCTPNGDPIMIQLQLQPPGRVSTGAEATGDGGVSGGGGSQGSGDPPARQK